MRSTHQEVFLVKGVLKISTKFTGEHPCQSVIPIKLQSNSTEITFRHRCSPVNSLHIFRTPFTKNTSGRLLLEHFVYFTLLTFHLQQDVIMLYLSYYCLDFLVYQETNREFKFTPSQGVIFEIENQHFEVFLFSESNLRLFLVQ